MVSLCEPKQRSEGLYSIQTSISFSVGSGTRIEIDDRNSSSSRRTQAFRYLITSCFWLWQRFRSSGGRTLTIFGSDSFSKCFKSSESKPKSINFEIKLSKGSPLTRQ